MSYDNFMTCLTTMFVNRAPVLQLHVCCTACSVQQSCKLQLQSCCRKAIGWHSSSCAETTLYCSLVARVSCI